MARRPHGWGKALLASLTPDKRARLLGERAERAPEAKPAAPKARMNKTETRYAQGLEARVRFGHLKRWYFEPLSLRLAQRTWYRPDFLVVHADGSLEFVEVKGPFVRDRAMIKPKVAAELFPCFRFTLAQWSGGTWRVSRIGG